MQAKHKKYLETMGIEIWQQRGCADGCANCTCDSDSSCQDNPNLGELEQLVLKCSKCTLQKTRNNVVFGVGNPNADLMFVGEAPGANEDAQGEPFVGRAGKLLDSMCGAMRLKRADIYIANILKCRPPNNRDPLPEEIKVCTPYLQKQIDIIKPKLIIALGRIAAQHLLATNTPLGKLRGQIHSYGEQQTPLLVTYHPAYLLRAPGEKAKAYIDVQRIQKYLATGEL